MLVTFTYAHLLRRNIMPSEQDERIKQLFIMEAEEHLVTLENGLVDLKTTCLLYTSDAADD